IDQHNYQQHAADDDLDLDFPRVDHDQQFDEQHVQLAEHNEHDQHEQQLHDEHVEHDEHDQHEQQLHDEHDQHEQLDQLDEHEQQLHDQHGHLLLDHHVVDRARIDDHHHHARPHDHAPHRQ